MQFIKDNPALIALAWALLSAFLTAFFGPHSEEQLKAYPAWAQKALHFTGAMGVDVPKLLQLLRGLNGGGGGAAVLVVGLAVGVSGCAWWDAHGKTVETIALDAASIACIEASAFTDAPAVVEACKIDKTLTPLVEQLIAQKMAAKKAGFSWRQPGSDAGAEAGQ